MTGAPVGVTVRLTSRRAALLGLGLAAALRPTLARPAPPRIRFEDLYKSVGVLGMQFADALVALAGREVAITGYMAPPLKPESEFFVLSRGPLAICPFCQSDADWPLDIVVVYLARSAALAPPGARVTATGRLELGSWTDPKTRFVSQIRIAGAETGG